MLLRAGLLYLMAVTTVLLGGLVLWQGSELKTRGESVATLTRRVATLKKDLDAVTLREQSADRRARVAEDSLARKQAIGSEGVEPPNEAHAKLAAAYAERNEIESLRTALEADLGKAIRELDVLNKERDVLKAEAEAAKRDAAKARSEAESANEAAEAALKELSSIKNAASKAAAEPVAVMPAPADPQAAATNAEVLTETGVVAATGALAPSAVNHVPAAEAAETPKEAAPQPKPEEAKQAIPERKSAAVTIEPDPEATKAEAAKPSTDGNLRSKVDPKPRTEKKPAKKSQTSVTKKAPKAAEDSGSPFFPF